MPLRDSEAIVLRTYPLGDADRLVSLLTRAYGRLRGVAQGARRPKSRYGASLEPLTYLRVWFYEKETRELVRLGQCEIIESFLDVQQDYRSGLALALAAEITELVLPEREPQDSAFRLLLHVVRGIKQARRADLALGYFLVWTMRLAGWLPELDRCSSCRREAGQQTLFWSRSATGLYCAQCRRLGMVPLSLETLSAARRMLAAPLGELAAAGANSPRVTAEFEAYFLDMIEHHAEKRLTSRRFYEETR
ncbi:MAG TPA: DNA repair protein RecO [Candidatus Acidoferrales bacterium]|nr:DNA repair protein RecO [Candidatus Acidoferrales bacterium]